MLSISRFVALRSRGGKCVPRVQRSADLLSTSSKSSQQSMLPAAAAHVRVDAVLREVQVPDVDARGDAPAGLLAAELRPREAQPRQAPGFRRSAKLAKFAK